MLVDGKGDKFLKEFARQCQGTPMLPGGFSENEKLFAGIRQDGSAVVHSRSLRVYEWRM